MIVLPHRTAALVPPGDLWEYDHARQLAMCTVAGEHIDIPVCGPDAPRWGAFAIRKISHDEWHISPERYRKEYGEFRAHPASYPGSDLANILALKHTPRDIGLELVGLLLGERAE